MKLVVSAALMLLISDPGTVSAQEPRLRGVATAVFEEQVNEAAAIDSNPHGTSHSPDEDSSPDSNSPDEDYDEEDEPEEAQSSSFVKGWHKPSWQSPSWHKKPSWNKPHWGKPSRPHWNKPHWNKPSWNKPSWSKPHYSGGVEKGDEFAQEPPSWGKPSWDTPTSPFHSWEPAWGSTYVADLGWYGTVTMTVNQNGKYDMDIDLKNLNDDMFVSHPSYGLKAHLHSGQAGGADKAVGAYAEDTAGLCDGAFTGALYLDISAKYGKLDVDAGGSSVKTIKGGNCPDCEVDYLDPKTEDSKGTDDSWYSVVFHDGKSYDRVLCANLLKMTKAKVEI